MNQRNAAFFFPFLGPDNAQTKVWGYSEIARNENVSLKAERRGI